MGSAPHQALDALKVGIQRKKVNWVLDADIRGFFDNMSHEWTMKFIEHLVADRRILRLIRNGSRRGCRKTASGRRQSWVRRREQWSPLLANVHLHYVFDLWADIWRKKVATGDIIVVRYADDLVVGFQHRTDAERFQKEFRERLAKFGLELHPDKTRLFESGVSPLATGSCAERGNRRPSRSWNLLTSAGNATRAQLSP
jgi:RNA-directed DNA polymerase